LVIFSEKLYTGFFFTSYLEHIKKNVQQMQTKKKRPKESIMNTGEKNRKKRAFLVASSSIFDVKHFL
jgi:hypothetical protein